MILEQFRFDYLFVIKTSFIRPAFSPPGQKAEENNRQTDRQTDRGWLWFGLTFLHHFLFFCCCIVQVHLLT